MNERASSPRAALDGIRVVELSGGVAGCYCTRLLAGLGAEVIKVESSGCQAIDMENEPLTAAARTRRDSALFHHLNGSKKSVCLDLGSPGDRDQLRGLARRANVLVESFAPGRMVELGLEYPSVALDNPSLVMTSITGFGQEGPYRDYQSSDFVGLAMGGMLCLCGESGGEPRPLWGAQAECLAGLSASVAILAALLQVEGTGLGQRVDVSMMESVVSVLQEITVEWLRSGEIPTRNGNLAGRSYPMTLLPCRDGYAGVMIGADEDWELFARITGLAELTAPRFARGGDRYRLASAIEQALRPYLGKHTRRELYLGAQEFRIPFSMALTPEEVLEDPQHNARSFFTSVQHPELGEVVQLGGPFRMAGSPWKIGRAPLLGEHTEEILRGMDHGGSGNDPVGPAVSPPSYPLGGVRVLDLTCVWAGPLSTQILADLGAEVIKVEAPERPDGTRANPGLFSWLNRNRGDLALDLTLPPARERFLRLVLGCDVVVENFSPRVMRNFGLDYQALREVRPDLVMLSMPAYGSTGPYAQHGAYGPGLEASSGLATLTGLRTGKPLLSGSAYGDPVAGLHGAVAVLAALIHRRRTGQGQWIELAQREALSHMFGEAFLLAAQGAPVPAIGGHDVLAAPQGCYRCRGEDRWIAIDCHTEEQWRRLCTAMGRVDMGHAPAYSNAKSRRVNEAQLRQDLEAWTGSMDPRKVMTRLQEAGVPAGVVMDARDLSVDPHLASRGFFVQMADLDGNLGDFPGRPWKATAMAPLPLRPAPRLGEYKSGAGQRDPVAWSGAA